jgi:hypothetical protein
VCHLVCTPLLLHHIVLTSLIVPAASAPPTVCSYITLLDIQFGLAVGFVKRLKACVMCSVYIVSTHYPDIHAFSGF